MEKRTSAFARIFAALALAGAVVAVIVVLSSGVGQNSSSSKGHNRSGDAAKHEKRSRTKADSYVVKSGDTLTSIAHRTGVPVSEILALNPEVDPQILIAGETLQLR
ncbi:MAG: LysM domain-containing protein [Solirubrobacterales bacterium]